jgi:hypothetical protein
VDTKRSVFWDITQSISVKVNRRFGGLSWLKHEASTKQARSQSVVWFVLISCLAYYSILKMGPHVPPKRRSTFNELHGVYPRRLILFLRGLFKDNFSTETTHRQTLGWHMNDDEMIRSGRDPIEIPTLEIPWKCWRKLRKFSVRITGVPAEIRTEYWIQVTALSSQ